MTYTIDAFHDGVLVLQWVSADGRGRQLRTSSSLKGVDQDDHAGEEQP